VGCGEEPPGGPPPPPPADGAAGGRPPPAEDEAPGAPGEQRRSPEDQPGGAGDEEPIRSEAVLTGRDGRLSPRVVRVPAFIAVRLELRSGDGARYAARVAGRTLRAAGSDDDATMLDGLPPGERYAVRAVEGARGTVHVEASAEPGP
jgi:hypothetical protein